MNIIKIQDQLRGVPDNTLVGYVQNPTGQVPTYLALSELQRRKEMRSKFQANKPEEKSVAEDLVQEAQPGLMSLPDAQPMAQAMQPPPEMPTEQMAQGGLAELDVGNMYDENNYASGGIVAFANGGMPEDRTFAKDISTIQRYITSLPQHLVKPFIELASKTTAEKAYQTIAKNYPSMPQTLLGETPTPSVVSPTATTGGPREVTTDLPKSFTGIEAPSQFGPSISAMNQMSTPAPRAISAIAL